MELFSYFLYNAIGYTTKWKLLNVDSVIVPVNLSVFPCVHLFAMWNCNSVQKNQTLETKERKCLNRISKQMSVGRIFQLYGLNGDIRLNLKSNARTITINNFSMHLLDVYSEGKSEEFREEFCRGFWFVVCISITDRRGTPINCHHNWHNDRVTDLPSEVPDNIKISVIENSPITNNFNKAHFTDRTYLVLKYIRIHGDA